MRILLLGLTSNIGFKFYKRFSLEFEIYATYRQLPKEIPNNNRFIKLESLSIKTLNKLVFDFKPEIIINTIAEGSIDKCEADFDLCSQLNKELVENLVNVIKNKDIKLIHFSSNAIYDGKTPPYTELSPPNPVNNYGKLKLKSDLIIRGNLKNYLLLRPITLIGKSECFQRLNPATFIISKIEKNQKLKLVNDDIVNFLYLDDLVNILFKLIKTNATGEFNISGDDILSRYELGQVVLENISKTVKISECSSLSFQSLAKRAENTSFDNSKIKKTLNFKFTPIDVAIRNIISNI